MARQIFSAVSQRHVDLADAEFGQRVDHCIGDGAERAGRAAFAGAAHTQPICRRRHGKLKSSL